MRTHTRPFTIVLLAAMLIVGATQRLAAQTVSGRLIDQYTDKPIAGATITLLTDQGKPVGQAVKTAKDGGFSITAPFPGIYRLRADVAGYITAVTPGFELLTGDSLSFTWRLLAGAVSLRPIAITGNANPASRKLSGFEQRAQRHGFGYFFTRDQIDKLRPFSVTDLLRTVPGLIVQPSLRGFGNVVRTIEGCTPAVYLDGVRFPLMGESIDDIVSPQALEGIEVYTHATEVPAEFMGAFSNCGVIALWTRT
jgi:hypothetical protein